MAEGAPGERTGTNVVLRTHAEAGRGEGEKQPVGVCVPVHRLAEGVSDRMDDLGLRAVVQRPCHPHPHEEAAQRR